jgi:hypothetical protein
MQRLIRRGFALALVAALASLAAAVQAGAAVFSNPAPITINSPTGVAACPPLGAYR